MTISALLCAAVLAGMGLTGGARWLHPLDVGGGSPTVSASADDVGGGSPTRAVPYDVGGGSPTGSAHL